ncbi:MAG: SGNH/GDSL hydrolase family protein [Fimbriimonadaceae bacterium]|nr:SGNH/GDSL hydrolase family protein [Chitinophagales bacterium]
MSLIILIALTSVLQLKNFNPENYSLLCLGDSYTIGQSVKTNGRFPEQTVSLLNKTKSHFESPTIIAGTGWTTKNLIDAIEKNNLQQKYDYVTLLIGVNDQFRGIDTAIYAANFEKLLLTAIKYADEKKNHVIVLSIPDYGVTPFANYSCASAELISNEIDTFNSINKRIAAEYKVHYIDITAISRKAKDDTTLLADDGLHPSGKMYMLWAELVGNYIINHTR